MTNLFDIPTNLAVELVETLLNADNLRIERIVSHGHASPPDFWYDQDRHEWVLLVQRAARLRFVDEVVELKPGDFVNIQAHKRHRVEWTTPDELTTWPTAHYSGAFASEGAGMVIPVSDRAGKASVVFPSA